MNKEIVAKRFHELFQIDCCSTGLSLHRFGIMSNLNRLWVLPAAQNLRSKPSRLGIMNVYNLCICHRPTFERGVDVGCH